MNRLDLHAPGRFSVSSIVCGFAALLLAASGLLHGQELEGVVTDATTGKPLRRAEVVLRPTNGLLPRGSMTDEAGRFVFFNIPAGEYFLLGARTGYLPSTTAFAGLVRLPQPFAIQANRIISDIRLPLQPAAVISGKVMHQDGERAAGVQVTAHREFWDRLQHGYTLLARGVSNDRGEYRLFGLPPGRYVVMAALTPFATAEVPAVEDQPVRDSQGQPVAPLREITTFLPTSPDLPGATSIDLRTGSEFLQADITLAQARTGRIIGRLRSGKTGEDIRGSIALYREDGSGTGLMPMQVTVRPLPQNKFEILHLAPGSYQIEIEGGERGNILYSRQPVRVAPGATSEIELVLPSEIRVRGRVHTARREDRLPEAHMRVLAEVVGPRRSTRAARVDDLGNFELSVLPGEQYFFRLEGVPRGWYLHSARLDTTDVLARGMSLTSAPAAGAFSLTVSSGAAKMYGIARQGARVVLQPVDGSLHRWAEANANEYGIFAFDSVVPGAYNVMSWTENEPPCDLWNPNARAACARVGQRVNLIDAGTESVSLLE